MSMYDTVEVHGKEYQTKSFGCVGASYRVRGGVLQHRVIRITDDACLARAWGIRDPSSALESHEIEEGWEDKDYTGWITLNTSEFKIQIEFVDGHAVQTKTETIEEVLNR